MNMSRTKPSTRLTAVPVPTVAKFFSSDMAHHCSSTVKQGRGTMRSMVEGARSGLPPPPPAAASLPRQCGGGSPRFSRRFFPPRPRLAARLDAVEGGAQPAADGRLALRAGDLVAHQVGHIEGVDRALA